MIIPCRFSFVNVFEPKADLSGRMKYSAQLIIPKEGQILGQDAKNVVDKIHQAVMDAADKAVAKGKLTKQQITSSKFKKPLRDGDEAYEDNPEQNGAVKDCWYLNASNTTPPGVVDRQAKPIMDKEEFYSGCYGYADIQFFGFNQAGNIGVGVSLQNVMKKKDGDRLDGRQSAEDAFANVKDSDDDTDDVPFD